MGNIWLWVISGTASTIAWGIIAHYGVKQKPLPLWQECAIWGVLAFGLTETVVKMLPSICAMVRCY